MRRSSRRRNRATWFPILGFDTTASAAAGALSTVDVRTFEINANGGPNVLAIPIIPDIDIPPEVGQGVQDGAPIRTLRDIVEGQSCLIERIVGNIQWEIEQSSAAGIVSTRAICCSALAVLPTVDDGTGDPAITSDEFDPLRADNSAQPWLWRRVWVMGNTAATVDNAQTGLPTNNLFGSLAEGSKIDTKGTKRMIRREERIFLIHSVLQPFPDTEGTFVFGRVYADLRVIGTMRKAHNRSSFK